MNTPDQSPSHREGTAGLTDEELAGETRARPIIMQRKALILWLIAASATASLLTVTAIIGAGRFHSQEEISRLEKTIGKLAEEKQSALKQLNDLRNSHYAQTIAERRCEVIDGLEDCLRAGLKRPERFAESDRQLLEARRTAAAKPMEPDRTATADAAARTPIKTARIEPPARERTPATPPTTRKLTLDEFAQELGKIPGVAVDRNIAEDSGSQAPDAKAQKKPAKPGS